MGSASASASTGSLAVTWSADATYVSGVTYNFHHAAIQIGGATQTSTQQSGSTASGASGSTSWGVTAYYGSTGSAAAVSLGGGFVTVPPPLGPPPTPAAPGGLSATDNTSSVQLDWSDVSHPSDTTITYEVLRGGTSIATGLTSPTYMDASPGATRPLTYQVRVKSVGGGTVYSGVSYSDYSSVTTNAAPFAPTLTSPADDAALDLTIVQRLRWLFSSPTAGDAQSGYDLDLSSDAGSTWVTISAGLPNQLVDLAASYLTAGAWQWRVRCYGATGLVSPWSVVGHFTAGSPTTGITVTYPASNGFVGQSEHVDWSTSDQVSYRLRRVADNNGSPDTGTIYWDSGDIAVGARRTAPILFDVNGRFEHVQLQVTGASGIPSAWVDVLVFAAFAPPPAALLYLEPIVTVAPPSASLRCHVTSPLPSDGVPPAIGVSIQARPVGTDSVEWERGQTTPLDATGTVDFETPASGVEYEFAVTTIAESGATTTTDWMR